MHINADGEPFSDDAPCGDDGGEQEQFDGTISAFGVVSEPGEFEQLMTRLMHPSAGADG